MFKFRFSVFAQLITSFVLAVTFTVAAAGVGIYFIQNIHKGIDEVALSRLPAMTLAYQLGQQSEAIVASAPILDRVVTQTQREKISFKVSDRDRWLQEIIYKLQGYDFEDNVLQNIDLTRKQLLDNYNHLDQLIRDRIVIVQYKKKRHDRLQEIIRNQGGFKGQNKEIWGTTFHRIVELLLIYETENDPNELDFHKEQILAQFENGKALARNIFEGLGNPITEIREVALGENGLIALNAQEKKLAQSVSDILAINERLSVRFVYSVNDLIRRMREEIEESSVEFQQSVETSTQILTGLVLACVVLVTLMGGTFIRRILKRLQGLKQSMRIHAEGGEADIPLEGEDEIADMGHALKYLVDVIDHRERDLRLSEVRFRDIAESTSDWFWETDQDLQFSMVSERFFEITGFARGPVMGHSWFDFEKDDGSNIDESEKWLYHLSDLKNRRKFRDFSYTIKCPDGQWRQIKTSGKPIFKADGEFSGYRGTGSDVTAEAQARNRLTAANEIMPGAFALWDHEDRLLFCNRKYYQYYKILSDLIDPGIAFKDLVSVLEERGGIRDTSGYVERRLKFREKPNGIFIEALSNGRYLQVSESSTLDGGTVSLVIDITDRIEAERRLEQARLESENANKAKSKFLAAASHDLRQPLHAIGMFLSALEERRRKDKNESAEGDLRIIENIADSLGALRGLLNALLDISKLDAGVMHAEFGPVMLRPLVERLLKQQQDRVEEKGLSLRSVCPNVAVRSDGILLERVLSNLLSNAVRYTSKGGVLLGVRCRGNKILIEIYDTGVGIPKDKVKDIFVEFQQLDNPARDRRRGLGLGLAIVERVLVLLDHPLHVHSVVGQGSCFSLEIGADKVQEVVIPEKIIEAGIIGADVPLIVVIDDEPDILDGMEQLITGWNYDVIAALSTQDALNQLDKTDVRPSLILADYRLQEKMTGADSIRAIQEKLNYPIPAAIITGDTAPERIQDAKASGFVLLHKPLQPAKLRQLIRNVQVQTLTKTTK